MNKKFKLLSDDTFELLYNETIELFGRILFRKKAKINFGDVETGELGGYIEKEENLSENGDAEVSGDALVYGNACVSVDDRVYGNARVY